MANPLTALRDTLRLASAYRVQRREARERAWDRMVLKAALDEHEETPLCFCLTDEEIRKDLDFPYSEDS